MLKCQYTYYLTHYYSSFGHTPPSYTKSPCFSLSDTVSVSLLMLISPPAIPVTPVSTCLNLNYSSAVVNDICSQNFSHTPRYSCLSSHCIYLGYLWLPTLQSSYFYTYITPILENNFRKRSVLISSFNLSFTRKYSNTK